MFDIEVKYGKSEVKLSDLDINPGEYAQVYGAICDLALTVDGKYMGEKPLDARILSALDAFRIIGKEIHRVNERNCAMAEVSAAAIEALGPYADETLSLANCIKKVLNENNTMQNQLLDAYELQQKTERKAETLESYLNISNTTVNSLNNDKGSLNRHLTSTMEELASANKTIDGVRIALGITSGAIPSSVLPDTVAVRIAELRSEVARTIQARDAAQDELERTHKEVVSLRVQAANTLNHVWDGLGRKPTDALDVLVASALDRAFQKGRKDGSVFTLNGQAAGEYATLCELVTEGAVTMRLLRRLVFLVDDIDQAQGHVLASVKTYLMSQGQLSSEATSV